MLAYHSDPSIKARYLARVEGHAEADEIIKGQYWEAGKGCAVGCTVHGEAHEAFERELGIPIVLAWLEDVIFEGLPNRLAKTWPERFLSAIEPGADLSVVGWRLLHWLLTESGFGDPDHPLVAGAVRRCAALLRRAITGSFVDAAEAAAAAAMAEEAAVAAEAAGAMAAAWIAESAARAAESVMGGNLSGERAAMAVSAAIARSVDYVAVSEALLGLLRACTGIFPAETNGVDAGDLLPGMRVDRFVPWRVGSADGELAGSELGTPPFSSDRIVQREPQFPTSSFSKLRGG